VYALNVLNSHPLLFNAALQPFTFYGATFTLQPLTSEWQPRITGELHR